MERVGCGRVGSGGVANACGHFHHNMQQNIDKCIDNYKCIKLLTFFSMAKSVNYETLKITFTLCLVPSDVEFATNC